VNFHTNSCCIRQNYKNKSITSTPQNQLKQAYKIQLKQQKLKLVLIFHLELASQMPFQKCYFPCIEETPRSQKIKTLIIKLKNIYNTLNPKTNTLNTFPQNKHCFSFSNTHILYKKYQKRRFSPL